jgi:hypothetical protein
MATSRSLPLMVSLGFFMVRCAFNRGSTKPIARTEPSASGSIGGIRQFAFVDRKASASNTLCQAILDTLEFDDPLVDPFRPSAREARPVSARRDTIGRKLAEFRPFRHHRTNNRGNALLGYLIVAVGQMEVLCPLAVSVGSPEVVSVMRPAARCQPSCSIESAEHRNPATGQTT